MNESMTAAGLQYNILSVERPDKPIISSKREVILSEFLAGGDELG
jgi:hypothetical protein